uniref:5-phosphohydroxy-L-lysine phospho-lyase n=1 Tax=Phallusia mammillata TaxID=59560 RepID=A0A6F9DN38_9ASCI|nr:5-phosphohydroxy-L-lysine phospho-lyase [Phallusia mammillata]
MSEVNEMQTVKDVGSQNGLLEEGLTKEESFRLREAHLASATTLYFRENPLKIVRGFKQYLFDEEGNQYLDCINNVAHVGHCHPIVTEAACQQISQLYTNSRYLHDHLSTYVYRLTHLFPNPLEVCFLTNSGSEANDLALQLAKAHTGGRDVITIDGAYHGHLQSCLDISPFKWRGGIKEKPEYTHVVSSPNVYRGTHAQSSNPAHDYALEVKKAVDDIANDKNRKLSAFIMESLQSCGGQVLPPPGYMAQAFSYVRDAGGVCIADEVQVGFGRIGTHYWAFEPQGVVPDIVTIGKPMGNGHPVSGVVTTRAIAESYWKIADGYFNTFGGNPVSCAIAHAVLDVIEEENLLKNAIDVGKHTLNGFKRLMEKYPLIGDVRGQGLFLGIELVKDRQSKEPAPEESNEIYRRMKNRFIIISVEGPDKNVIKFKPPMCFSRSDADHLLQVFDEVLASLPTADMPVKVSGKIFTIFKDCPTNQPPSSNGNSVSTRAVV